MAQSGKLDQRVLDQFTGRWGYMKDILTYLAEQEQET